MEFNDVEQVEKQLEVWVRSGVQCVQLVVGGAAAPAEQSLIAMAKRMRYSVAVWDCLKGWNNSDKDINPVEAIQKIAVRDTFDENTLIVMRDLHYELLQNPNTVAALKLGIQKQAFNTKSYRRPVFLVTPSTAMNPDVLPYIKQIVYPPPNLKQRLDIFDGVRASISDATKKQCSDQLRYQIASALAGLTSVDASDALSEALVKHGGIKPEVVDTIEVEKGRMLKKSEVLTYIPKSEILKADELGGYEELKQWLDERAVAYTPEAAELGLDYPKGVVLIGVPGAGKSVCADVIARKLGLPRVTFAIDAVFNSLVGESERRTREAIQTVEAMEGSVLLIDEADKVLGGAIDSTGDSGVTRRIFGQILSWLAAKKTRTFVVLTMNRVTGMPPELLRRGRFDEIFFVDTPDERERKVIFEIHMRKRRIDPAAYSQDDWHEIVSKSKDYVGAEIEQAVSAARFTAYRENPASKAIPTAAQLVKAIEDIVPIVRVDPENIDAIRKFGKDRARNVSGVRAAARKGGRNQRALDLDLPFGGSGGNN